MVFSTIQYKFTADGRQFKTETDSMAKGADNVGDSIAGATAKIAGLVGSIGAAVALMKQLVDEGDRLDAQARERLISRQLTGASDAEVLAWEAVRADTGVGPEQVFDMSEAITDRLRNKPDSFTDPLMEGVGLTEQDWMAAESNAARASMLIEALAGLDDDDAILEFASEMGAGDTRDALIVSALPEQARPAARTEFFAPHAASEAEDRRSFLTLAGKEDRARAADSELSTRSPYHPANLARMATFGPFEDAVNTAVIGEDADDERNMFQRLAQFSVVDWFTGGGNKVEVVVEDRSNTGLVIKPRSTTASDETTATIEDRRDPHVYRGD